MKKRIVLASASPQRKKLLSLLFDEFEICPTDADETLTGRNIRLQTARLSRLKAEAAAETLNRPEQTLIIAADTLVSVRGQLLGKPQTRREAAGMLDLLSGRTHRVATGLTLWTAGKRLTRSVETKIVMARLTAEMKERYLDTNEWQGAAGGYRIQNSGEVLFLKIIGSYSNVVGLPAAQLRLLIAKNFPEFL